MNDVAVPEIEPSRVADASLLLGQQIETYEQENPDMLIGARALAYWAVEAGAAPDVLRSTRDHIAILNGLDRYIQGGNGAEGSAPFKPNQTPVFEKLRNFVAEPPVDENGQLVRRGNIVMPVRTGKTAVFSKLVDAITEPDGRASVKTLILVPRKFMIDQTVGDEGLEKFAARTNVSTYFGENKDLSGDVVVMTYQSFLNAKNNAELDDQGFGLVICDEAHKTLGKKTSKAIHEFTEDKLAIGLTATPNYAADKRVDQIFPVTIAEMHLREAIDSGLTAPVRALMHVTNATIPNLDPKKDDFTDRELQRLINLSDRNKAILDYATDFVADGRQGIVGCLPGYNLAHAKYIATELAKRTVTIDGQERAIRAAWVGGAQTAEQQKEIIAAYNRGEIDVLAHYQILSEALTVPNASFYINGCPTSSPVKLEQSVGRVLGENADGRESIVVDFIDKTSGKYQQTILALLGEEEFSLEKVIGSQEWHGRHGSFAHTYLRGILRPELLKQLTSISGQRVREILLGMQDTDIVDEEQLLAQAWESRLTSEGMPAEPEDTMGIPRPFLEAYWRAYEAAVNFGIQNPSSWDILDRLDKDRSALGLPVGSPKTRFFVQAVHGLIDRDFSVRHFDDGLGWDVAASDDVEEEAFNTVPTITAEQLAADYSITEREAMVIGKRFGLEVDGVIEGPHTLEEVAILDGTTRERIRQIEARTMSILRHPGSDHGILRYFRPEPASQYMGLARRPMQTRHYSLAERYNNMQKTAPSYWAGLHGLVAEFARPLLTDHNYYYGRDKFYHLSTIVATIDRALERHGLGMYAEQKARVAEEIFAAASQETALLMPEMFADYIIGSSLTGETQEAVTQALLTEYVLPKIKQASGRSVVVPVLERAANVDVDQVAKGLAEELEPRLMALGLSGFHARYLLRTFKLSIAPASYGDYANLLQIKALLDADTSSGDERYRAILKNQIRSIVS